MQGSKKDQVEFTFGEAAGLEKVNLLCSQNNPDAVFSFAMASTNLKHLDIRGNGLDAAFGWKLVKSMTSVLSLQTMNGMNVGALKENKTKHLNLVSLKSGNGGVFGIEVTGAIFLAQFLKVNTSLESLKFQNNQVGKEGAKAISQAVLNGNARIRSVNHMGRRAEKGLDFTQFRTMSKINLSDSNVSDEDIIFLGEWLEKYDNITSLDLSYNMIHEDGFATILNYVAKTHTLQKLNLALAPLDVNQISAVTSTLNQNKTLKSVNFHIGAACGESKEKQQILHDLALVLTKHPTITEFGEAPVHLDKIKSDKMQGYDPFALKKVIKYRNDIALSLWFIALCKPKSFTTLSYNMNRRPRRNSLPGSWYPDVTEFVNFYWSPITSIASALKTTLVTVDLGIPEGLNGCADVLKQLSGSTSLQNLYLWGFAGGDVGTVPKEWAGNYGRLPPQVTTLLGPRAKHWQCLNGFMSATPNLKVFNNVTLSNYREIDSAERAILLLFETSRDTSVTVSKTRKQTVLNLYLGRRADINFVLNCTRLVDRVPYRLHIHYLPELVYARDKVVTQRNDWKQMAYQQHDLAHFIVSTVTAHDGLPNFVHEISLHHPFVIPEVVETLSLSSLRSFSIDAIEKVLPQLVKTLKSGGEAVKLESIDVKRYWHPQRAVLKKFHDMGVPSVHGRKTEAYSERDLLKSLQSVLPAISSFVEISTPTGVYSKKVLLKSTTEEFAQKFSGVQVQYPKVGGVYTPNIMLEFVFDPKSSKYPPRGYRRLGMTLPLAPAHRGIRSLNLANCMIKQEIKNTARSDEFADSSKPLWAGKMVHYRPNETGPFVEQGVDYTTYMRFHWEPKVRIGSSDAEKVLKSQGFMAERDLMRLIIVTLLKSPALTNLDLRGNGFDKEDVVMLLEELKKNKDLKMLNGIPLGSQGAAKLTKLEFDGTGVPVITNQMKENYDESRAYGQDTCKYATVEMSEGDGLLFASLVTAENFTKLRHLSISKHRMSDAALSYVCDAIAALPKLEDLDLQRIYVSNRGANMLLDVICQRAENLRSLNGLPLSILQQEAVREKGTKVAASGPILWNEYTLAVASKLKLWGCLRFTDQNGVMDIDNRGMTDIGLRGISGKLKFDAQIPDSISSVRSAPIVKLDLSGNKQITDTSLADLTRNLLQKTTAPSLTYLDTRYCPRLLARSAFELYYLLHPKGTPTTTVGTQKLQVINGVDIKVLQECARANKPAPPFVIRLYAGALKASPTLSECDAHFFAHVLHMFPNVSHCHVHVEVTRHKRVYAWHGDTVADVITSDSPFRPPQEDALDEVQKQIGAAKKLFDACPAATVTQFSAIPRVPVRTPPTSIKGDVLVPSFTGARATADAGGHFGQMVAMLLKNKDGKARSPRKKPFYVNNINMQRSHDCFRTLYGVDDVDLVHDDVCNPRNRKQRVALQKVDFSSLFGICTSLDIQHLWFSPIDHITELKSGCALTHLNFTHNNLGDPGLRELCRLLVSSKSRVAHLGLAHDNISDSGVRHFCSALSHLPKLSSVDFAHNFITDIGGIALAECLGGYNLTNKKGDHGKPDIKMLSLDLQGNKILDKGAMRFAEFITLNRHLQFLNLRDNEIGFVHDEAIAALVYCATDNTVLSVLDIRDNFRKKRNGRYEKTRPPQGLMHGLLEEVSISDFDQNEVYQGIFIRRKRQ